MDEDQMRELVAAARVARLATVRPDGSPHVVPFVFALDGDTLFTAIDAKPKRSERLQRRINIEANPRVSVLVDHYAEPWSDLWWIRVDGVAREAEGEEAERARDMLVIKYEDYTDLPGAPIIAIDATRWRGWRAR